MEDNLELENDKYERCWACGNLCLKKRIEGHHLLGKKNHTKEFPLCILCHDYVDRMPLKNIEVFGDFLVNTISELERIPSKDYRFIKLFFLKASRLMFKSEFEDKKTTDISFNDKQI